MRGLIAILLTVALGAAGCSYGGAGSTSPLARFTGGETRAVWVQSDGTDPFALGTNLTLMGFDSRDGAERTLLAERSSYIKPMIAPRGDRIVFTRGPAAGGPEIFRTDWRGASPVSLGRGFALALWQNPSDGSDWVYAGIDAEQGRLDFPTVVRFPLDNPGAREVVWNKTLVSADTFQVSPDGRHAGGLFPWPEAGIATLPNGSMTRFGDGCWTALASVRGPLMWYFDGAHRNLTMVDVRTERRWMVNINGVPGFGNDEVYHPRWTNHPRFLVMSGPYNQGGANQVRSGGTQAEVYIGRFSGDYSRVEAWHRVTGNTLADSYPDIWIDRRDNPHQTASGAVGPAAAAPASPGSVAAPAQAGRIVVEARLRKTPAIPRPASIEPYRHALVAHEYEVVRVVEGTYADTALVVAHWVIRDSRLLPDAQRKAGATVQLTLERYDAHPELEGERLISASDTPKLPLYYDIAR
jgi:hypothetical protein